MTIKNRINKLEKQTRAGEDFCQCPNIQRCESYVTGINGATEENPQLYTDAVPDFCRQCSRPIQKQMIIVNFTSKPTEHGSLTK